MHEVEAREAFGKLTEEPAPNLAAERQSPAEFAKWIFQVPYFG